MEWKYFSYAIKEARQNSKALYGFQTWQRVRVYSKRGFFDLNPFRVNLKTGSYGSCQALQTGETVIIGDLRTIVKQM